MTMLDLESLTTHRRGFLGRVAAGAAAVGLGGLFAPLRAAAEPLAARRDASASPDFEAWLNKMTGKHKMVFDVPEPNDGFAFAWGRSEESRVGKEWSGRVVANTP